MSPSLARSLCALVRAAVANLAARAIVAAEPDGFWVAAWGVEEDLPDFVTLATISNFDPPRRLVLSDDRYRSKDGPLPFAADFTVTFSLEPKVGGTQLVVTQSGFPKDACADLFLTGCIKGWHDTLKSIQRHVEEACSRRHGLGRDSTTIY